MLRQVCSVIGGVAAGPVGSLLGGITGGLLGAAVETVLPGASGVITNAASSFGSEAYRALGQRVLDGLPPEERTLINHDLQRAFRLAALDALAEIGGRRASAEAQRDPRGVPPEVRFNFAELPPDLREPMRTCFADLARAITDGTLLPITAPALSDESVATYIDQTSLAMLSGTTSDDRTTLLFLSELFYDETVGPWLTTHSGFLAAELAPLQRHLRRHTLPRTLVHFNERIKDPANTQAWRAFNRTLLEQIRAGIADVQHGQRELHADQRELTQRIDNLLRQSATSATLPAYADGMGAVLSAVGHSEQHLDEALATAFARANSEQTALQAVLRDALARIERKIDAIGDTTKRIESQLGTMQDRLERSVVPRLHVPHLIAERDVAACPYPGLAVFGDGEASYFFGRDADIARLLRHTNRPVVAVTGPSGVGKSSFVLAGVLPHLRAQHPQLEHIIFRVSTSAELLRDLAATLASHTNQPLERVLAALQSDDAALRDTLLALNAGGRVALVLDQFEELFVGADKSRVADRARLLDLLLDIEKRPDPRLLVILTSRENFFEHPDYLARPELRPIIVERGVALAGLSDIQLRDAILKPLAAFNARPERAAAPPVAFEAGVIDLFEQEFRRTERTLPLVQYLLRLLWTERRELSVAAYTQLGGLERALDRHAGKIYEMFSQEDQRVVRAVLLALVRPGIDNEYTRRRVARDELIGAGGQRDRVSAVIGRLANQDSRIISEQQVGQASYLELTHEVLLKQWERLRVLVDTYRERLQTRDALLPDAEQWLQSAAQANGRGDATYLYRGSQLRLAKTYIRTNDLPEGIDTSIQTCYQASVRHQRRQAISGVLGTIAVVAALAFGFNWYTADQRARLVAEQQVSSQRATAQVLAQQTAQAEALQRGTAEANAAQEGERARREAEAANAQRLATLARQTFAQGDRSLAVALALAANERDNPPIQAQQALAEVAYAPGLAGEFGPGIAISPNGLLLLDVQDGGRVVLRDVATSAEQELGGIALHSDPQSGTEVPTVQFSADSGRVVVGSSQEIVAWSTADGSQISRYAFSKNEPGTSALSINANQGTFVRRAQNGEIQLCELQSGRVIQRITDNALNDIAENAGAFSRDGRYLLVGGGFFGPGDAQAVDGKAILWDTQTNTVLAHVSDVSDHLTIGPETPGLEGIINMAYVGDDDAVHVWSYSTYEKQMVEGPKLSNARGPLLWSSDAGFIIATKSDGSGVYLWNLAKDAQLLPGAGTPLSLVVDDAYLALLRNGTVVRYDLANAAQLVGRTTPSGRANYIGTYTVLVAPDGKSVLTGDNQPDVTEFHYQSLDDGTRTMVGYGYLKPVVSADRSTALVSMIPASTQIVEQRGELHPLYQVLDLATGKVTREIGQTPYDPLVSPKYPRPALSADGRRAVAMLPADAAQNAIVIGLDLANQRELPQLGEAAKTYANLGISPDGKTALVLVADKRSGYDDLTNSDGPLRLLVWDIDSTTLRGTLDAGVDVRRDMQGFYIEPTDLVYSPDGGMFALTVAGGELRVWDARTLQEMWHGPTQNERVQFSPDSQFVLSAGSDGSVQLFEARTGALVHNLTEARGPAAFDPTGGVLITGDASQQVRVWDVATGSELRRFPLYGDLLTVTMAPDGKSFFTGSADGMKQWRSDALPELITWTRANRTVANLSCEQRSRYQVPPLCAPGTTATPAPPSTPAPAATLFPTHAATPSPAPPTPSSDGTQVFQPIDQSPSSSLRVVSARQLSMTFELVVEYTAADARKVGIEKPGEKNSFFIQQGGQRYPLRAAEGIVVGETTQSVPIGSTLQFTLSFDRLPEPTQPFDLIEGEHTAAGGTSYWDITYIRLR